ncbi:cell division protein FtsQ/DivIB [Sneathiella limimaris]|uniref:cell division protein FtsQ/DivIB n=1 Tax=Sneathiella limimaris TaxID=1964213 RepID=UPI00146AC0EB|nr:FtsQ-type POTRA domain-containing protein [Sneathiella limimaris]
MRQIKIDASDRPLGPQPKHRSKTKKMARSKQKARSNTSFVSSVRGVVSAASGKVETGFSSFTSLFRKEKSPRKSKPVKRRRGQRPIGRMSIFAGSVALVALLLGYGGYLIVTNDLIEKSGNWLSEKRLQAFNGAGLVVQEVSVVGRERTSPEQILAALNVTRGTSIVDFDPDLARERVEKIGWVESASVMRRFPDEIFVRIQERRPFARWQQSGKTVVIDRKGMVVSQQDAAEFRHLPKVVGSGANEKAADLFDLLAKSPTLFTRLQNAVRIRDRRWTLQFSNGVKVMLPEEGSAQAWLKLEALQEKQQILNKGVLAIDLRNSDRMFVRLRKGDAEFRREISKVSENRT